MTGDQLLNHFSRIRYAFCFSDPLEQRNYFSAGIVNRFHALNDNGAQPASAADAASLRMNVSTDWAPGRDCALGGVQL